MVKTWLAAARELVQIIKESPAAAYGAAMTGLVVFVLFLNYQKDAEIRVVRERELKEKDRIMKWAEIMQAEKAMWRDTAFVYQTKYEILLRTLDTIKRH